MEYTTQISRTAATVPRSTCVPSGTDRPSSNCTARYSGWRVHYARQSCADADFVSYREVETELPDCLQVHFVQGASSVTTLGGGRGGELFAPRNATGILEGRVTHPNKPDATTVTTTTHYYDRFCSFIVKYNSTRPTEMFQGVLYDIDAIVRHLFFLQLGEYKHE